MSKRDFSKAEADLVVGRLVRTRVAWSGVPEGTKGRVVRADDSSGQRWILAIQWDLPREAPGVEVLDIGGEPVLAVHTGKPLVDWFSRDEYEEYIEELNMKKAATRPGPITGIPFVRTGERVGVRGLTWGT